MTFVFQALFNYIHGIFCIFITTVLTATGGYAVELYHTYTTTTGMTRPCSLYPLYCILILHSIPWKFFPYRSYLPFVQKYNYFPQHFHLQFIAKLIAG